MKQESPIMIKAENRLNDEEWNEWWNSGMELQQWIKKNDKRNINIKLL